ncbi:uncharacterized protein EAE98_002449 [Botrytis deweyae]|uniref:Uncharacterized protein n=1 Tax=Botrytis deweyae TaxID=2478750 RepID=A0ABQ7IX67_9HELO|nr:uncharacterized protein EAE98_002449 [Botrytis deweyae]KAF7936230.1 hypothetical protein EAE98_002449 [Botrytis deweyae]
MSIEGARKDTGRAEKAFVWIKEILKMIILINDVIQITYRRHHLGHIMSIGINLLYYRRDSIESIQKACRQNMLRGRRY